MIKLDEFNQVYFETLNPSQLLRLHKSSSYMAYIIKDLAEYLCRKTTNGTYFILIQEAINNNKELNKRLSVLHDYIK